MEVHQLRYFRAVAQCGSFTRAAKREHVSQPSLSHQILKLEDELKAKLFHRTGKAIKLTPAGEGFLPVAESILQQLADAQSRIREICGVEGGRVRIGVIPTVAPFFMPNILSAFYRQHPLVEVSVIEESSNFLMQSLRERNIDLAVTPNTDEGKGLSFTELLQERLFAAVSDGHPLSKQRKITLDQLAGEHFLSLKDGHCFKNDVAAMFHRAHVEQRITFESGCFLTILNMVSAGIGISVVPEMAVKKAPDASSS